LGVLLLEALDMPGDRPALLKGIAHQISLRIENARLVEQVVEQVSARRSLEREIAMARDIQTSFLPRTIPEYAGWDIGVTWQLARMVGGDFYDFFQLPDGPNGPRWAIVIADVADKGVPASLFMALSRTLIRSVAFSRVDPSQTLQRANDLIISDSQSTMFVSVVKGLWEPAIARFSFANGGHNPPILVLPEEEPRVMTQHGMVLGVREDEQYQTQVVELPPGSAIVLYTDGVTEAMNPRGEAFGANRLCATIHEQNDCTAQSLSDLIRQRVTEFCEDADLDDDLTTVILRRLPSSARKPHLQNGRLA
jgi:serine phosphatase RsbU (regulator of sigma subunit)